MEDKKNVAKLNDEQLEQVAGGWGSKPYTDCLVYQQLLSFKHESTVDSFKRRLKILKKHCPGRKDDFNCANCPVQGEWNYL